MNEPDAIDMKRKNKFNGVEWRQREKREYAYRLIAV